MEEVAIKVSNCTKYYKVKEKRIIALKGLSYTFKYGKMYAIMGKSGSGKTTLINCISMLDEFDKGTIFLNGENIKNLDESVKSRIRNMDIGLIFQDFLLNENMKSFENVMLPMFLNKKIQKKNRKDLSLKLLKNVDLLSRANHYPRQLSGGEQQRVAIARAMANDPKIILADEPTGNLDNENEEFIFQKLKSLALSGKCVIIVSHEDKIKDFADEVIILDGGEIK